MGCCHSRVTPSNPITSSNPIFDHVRQDIGIFQSDFRWCWYRPGFDKTLFWKLDKVCLFHKKRSPFDQYESIATRYINRFAIEEDDQFEIHVYHFKDEYWIKKKGICETIEQLIDKAKKGSFVMNLRYLTYRIFLTIVLIHSKITWASHIFDPTQENIVLNQIHIISPTIVGDREFIKGIKTALKKFNLESTLLTCLYMAKYRCITKEKYEEAYKINEDIEERGDLSLGDDLETFVTNIKHGRLAKACSFEDNKKFLIRLLNGNERRRLDQKDKKFVETFEYNDADVPKAEWEASESNLKFSISRCFRITHFIEWSEN